MSYTEHRPLTKPTPEADLWSTSRTQSGLPFNGLHHRNPCNCMDYY